MKMNRISQPSKWNAMNRFLVMSGLSVAMSNERVLSIHVFDVNESSDSNDSGTNYSYFIQLL